MFPGSRLSLTIRFLRSVKLLYTNDGNVGESCWSTKHSSRFWIDKLERGGEEIVAILFIGKFKDGRALPSVTFYLHIYNIDPL